MEKKLSKILNREEYALETQHNNSKVKDLRELLKRCEVERATPLQATVIYSDGTIQTYGSSDLRGNKREGVAIDTRISRTLL
jgi:hypothetical protein